MNKKDLDKLGLTKDVIEKAELPDDLLDQIIALYGKSVTKLRSDLQTAEERTTTVQTQLDDANKQIAEYKTMDVESIRKSATEWETKAKQAEKDMEQAVLKLKLEHRVETELKDVYHFQDPADVFPHLKMDTIKLDGDKVIGLKEQAESLSKAKPYLLSPNGKGESDGSDEESEDTDEGNPAPKVTVRSNKKVKGEGTFADAIREKLKLP